MKISRDSISILIIIIGIGVFTSGFYFLGYHQGLEFMRKSDSGLGGLGELMNSWFRIVGGLIIVIIGIAVKAHNRR